MKTFKVWLARDSREDIMFGLGLCVHNRKPTRGVDAWSAETILFHLPWNDFPEVTWEDEPKEVELTIKD